MDFKICYDRLSLYKKHNPVAKFDPTFSNNRRVSGRLEIQEYQPEDKNPILQKQCPKHSAVWCRILEDDQNHHSQAWSLPEQVPAQDSTYILAIDNLKLWPAQKNWNRTDYPASSAKEMELDRACAAHAFSSFATSCPQMDPWWS